MNDNSPATGFIDSNVWLYAFIEGQDRKKHDAAKQLLQTCEPVLSTQVINEVCVNLLRKTDFTESDIGNLIASFYEKYEVVAPNRSILLSASELRERYSLSFWDSLVICSALFAGTPVLYSEDMQDGLVIEERLRILNPLNLEES